MGRDDEWIRGNEAHHVEYGETAGVPEAGWATAWGGPAWGGPAWGGPAWGYEAAGEEADEAFDDEGDDESDEDDWADGEGLGDESLDGEWLDGDPFAVPGGAPGRWFWRDWGYGGVPGFSTWIAVAVVAGVAGAAVGFLLTRGAPAARAIGATPSVSAPAFVPASAPASVPASAGGGGGVQALPGLPGNASGNGGGQVRILLTGRVLAVSGASVTIGGAGPPVTAGVTSATKISGRVHVIGGVKVGDEVAAQITGTPSHLVITSLQDPAR